MPFNGNGQFNRLYSWQADKAAGLDISSSRMDTDTNDIAGNGLSVVLTRDGQGQPTANLPMNGFHHTGAAPASGTGQYVTYDQLVGSGSLPVTFTGLTVNGNGGVLGTFNVSGGVGLSSFLNVTGATELLSTLNVSGGVGLSSFLNVAGAADMLGTLNVSGGVGLSSFLNVAGVTSLSGVLNCIGGVNLSNTGAYMTSGGVITTPTAWTATCGINCSNGLAGAGFFTVSDARLKSDVEDITPADGEDWVKRGRPRTYIMDGRPSAGFIAQEDIAAGRQAAVLSIADERPEFTEATESSAPGQRLIRDYMHDIAYLTAALKSALARIEALEKD